MSKSDFIKILCLFCVWRIGLFAIAFASPFFLPKFGGTFPYYQQLQLTRLPHFIWSFANFDGVHYLQIARDGYANEFTQAFFPLYPLLLRVIDSQTIRYLLIEGLIISNACFLIGLIFFFKLVSENYDKKIAFWALIFLLTFPTSFYFGAVYTEGLFFALTMAAFYLTHKNRILWASLAGLFASATRLIGVLLAPSLYFTTNIKKKYFVFLIPLGLIFYMLFLYINFGNPLLFLTSQEIFGQGRTSTSIVLPPQVLYRYLKILITSSGLPLFNAVFELLATLFAFLLLLLNLKVLKREWLIFSLSSLLVPALTGTLTSMPRYALVAFPIFITLANLKSNPLKWALAAIFLILLFCTTTLFTQGYWVA